MFNDSNPEYPETMTEEFRTTQRHLNVVETLMLDDSRMTFQHVDYFVRNGIGIGGRNALARKFGEYVILARGLEGKELTPIQREMLETTWSQ